MSSHTHRRTGFTLLEMTIVLAIIAVILAGGAVTFSAALKQQQNQATAAKMQQLRKALYDYWLTFGRLPCPADAESYNTSDTNFGREAANSGSCDGTPTANFVYNIDSDDTTVCDYSDATHDDCIYGGMVPTKTLQLQDEMAFDGWGRRILYMVDSDFTRTSARDDQSDITADSTNSVERIKVITSEGHTKSLSGVFLLLSFGEGGHGAYPRTVTGPGSTRMTTGTSALVELNNCHCLSTGVSDTFTNIFYQELQPAYDDFIVYATRMDLRTPLE